MTNTNAETSHTIKVNTDAFMAFSKIAMSSLEQLTALNLNTARSSLEESVTAAASMLDPQAAHATIKAKKAAPLAGSESATAYFGSVRDIVCEAQDEVRKLMNSYLSSQGNGSSFQAAWLKGFDAFNGFAQPFSPFTEANRKAISDATAPLVNPVNEHSRKST